MLRTIEEVWTPEVRAAVADCYERTADPETRARCQILLLAGEQSLSVREIAPVVRRAKATVNWVLRRFIEAGLPGLPRRSAPGPAPTVTLAWVIDQDLHDLGVPSARPGRWRTRPPDGRPGRQRRRPGGGRRGGSAQSCSRVPSGGRRHPAGGRRARPRAPAPPRGSLSPGRGAGGVASHPDVGLVPQGAARPAPGAGAGEQPEVSGLWRRGLARWALSFGFSPRR